jgi:hypothetical protein
MPKSNVSCGMSRRPGFNNTSLPLGVNLPLRVNFALKVKVHIYGLTSYPRDNGNVRPFVHPRDEQFLLFRKIEGRTEDLYPQGMNSPL